MLGKQAMLAQDVLILGKPFADFAAVQDSLSPSWRRGLIEALELALAATGTYRCLLVAFHFALSTGLAGICHRMAYRVSIGI